jgi:hypothetical protein
MSWRQRVKIKRLIRSSAKQTLADGEGPDAQHSLVGYTSAQVKTTLFNIGWHGLY